ncbi:hypothetical protein RP726_05305 [Candidatus Methylospira mobilis]|uniref:hypothetical protein n=1 Tax=Candidatus Methylospira mobilis TaxID=1808979 RepID=UPI0028F0B772|nr:hypothetical protein [Candidatus Methylospira mobilis]WNV05836.1 hypothetical protein RP726_05305 [Candidatus Methylospira mobilis]
MDLINIPLQAPDLSMLFEFQDNRTGEFFCVSLATLLQCLCIIEQRYIVPPLEPEWEAVTIPPLLRAMAATGNCIG